VTTYPTPKDVRSGETRPFPYDWTTRLLEVGAVSLVSSAWDVESGGVVLGNDTLGSVTAATNVTGSTTPDTDSVIVNSVVTNTGARLVERFHVFTVVGDWDSDTDAYYYGAGAAGLDAAGLALLSSVQADNPVRTFTVTLATQKLYLAYPASWADPVVYLSGFPVPMLAVRTVTILGKAYSVLESENLMTWTGAVFQARAS
jgi:hypothetical protein